MCDSEVLTYVTEVNDRVVRLRGIWEDLSAEYLYFPVELVKQFNKPASVRTESDARAQSFG
jgi:hypothetical protein